MRTQIKGLCAALTIALLSAGCALDLGKGVRVGFGNPDKEYYNQLTNGTEYEPVEEQESYSTQERPEQEAD